MKNPIDIDITINDARLDKILKIYKIQSNRNANAKKLTSLAENLNKIFLILLGAIKLIPKNAAIDAG
jgi:hypothetical protein